MVAFYLVACDGSVIRAANYYYIGKVFENSCACNSRLCNS